MKVEWYLEFVDKKYKPKSSDVVALFYYEPANGISAEEAIGRIASESSCGTWTTLTVLPKSLPKAVAFWYRENLVKIAYPMDSFEHGSIAGLMSAVGGNIYGMKALKNLRLIDIQFPSEYLKDFSGPLYGIDAIKKIFRRESGPITAVVPKPKVGFSASEHAKMAYELWVGGIDCVKDDENLTSQRFNRFEKRVTLLAKQRDRAERETGEVKDAFINVTAPDIWELERRIKLVHDNGFRYFMIDVVVSGFTAVQTATELARDYRMAIHGHRAMHAMFTRNPKHGMSMLVLAKLMRLAGVDQLHIGTVIGKLAGEREEVLAIRDAIAKREVNEIPGFRLSQSWGKIKPMLPVASGGLHPGILPEIFNLYGTTDIVVQVGGGTFGHPMGVRAGAMAVIQAIEAYKQNIPLEEQAEKHIELKKALEKWGKMKPV